MNLSGVSLEYELPVRCYDAVYRLIHGLVTLPVTLQVTSRITSDITSDKLRNDAMQTVETSTIIVKEISWIMLII